MPQVWTLEHSGPLAIRIGLFLKSPQFEQKLKKDIFFFHNLHNSKTCISNKSVEKPDWIYAGTTGLANTKRKDNSGPVRKEDDCPELSNWIPKRTAVHTDQMDCCSAFCKKLNWSGKNDSFRHLPLNPEN